MINQLVTYNKHSSSKLSKESSSGATPARGKDGSSSCPETKKPLRPLTAFHIFSQLEKEYIMQTNEEDHDAGSPDHGTKVTANENSLPQRYMGLDIPSDWCESPGKKKKRKHRKTSSSTSKRVDFAEMSRLIAARWSELDDKDPKTKLFCQNIAEQKLFEYRQDLIRYNESLQERITSTKIGDTVVKATKLAVSGVKEVKHRNPSRSAMKRGSSQAQGFLSSASTDLESLFKKNDLEIDLCVNYFRKISSQIYPNPQRTTPLPIHQISPVISQRSFSSVMERNLSDEFVNQANGGTRYGLVDIEDDEIIAMFQDQKEPTNESLPCARAVPCQIVDDAEFLSVCHPCML